jgi:hypothetical protein
MTITFNHPTRSRALYINRNRAEIEISETRGFNPEQATPSERIAMNEALALMAKAPIFTGDLSRHAEGGYCAVIELADDWVLAGTDIANVGGMQLSSDGFYVIRKGRIALCGEPLRSARDMQWWT